jgi:hypothetical protein
LYFMAARMFIGLVSSLISVKIRFATVFGIPPSSSISLTFARYSSSVSVNPL